MATVWSDLYADLFESELATELTYEPTYGLPVTVKSLPPKEDEAARFDRGLNIGHDVRVFRVPTDALEAAYPAIKGIRDQPRPNGPSGAPRGDYFIWPDGSRFQVVSGAYRDRRGFAWIIPAYEVEGR